MSPSLTNALLVKRSDIRTNDLSSVPYATRDWNSRRHSSGVYEVEVFIPRIPPRQLSRGLPRLVTR